jgi:hypothetical protein
MSVSSLPDPKLNKYIQTTPHRKDIAIATNLIIIIEKSLKKTDSIFQEPVAMDFL